VADFLLNFLYLSGEDAEEKALGKSGLPLFCPLQDLRRGERSIRGHFLRRVADPHSFDTNLDPDPAI
jgi:hypothetical protein